MLLLCVSLVPFFLRYSRSSESDDKKPIKVEPVAFPTVILIFVVCNLAMLLFVNSFIEQDDLLDDRLLLPIFGSSVILLLWIGCQTIRLPLMRNPIWLLPALAISLLFVTNVIRNVIDVPCLGSSWNRLFIDRVARFSAYQSSPALPEECRFTPLFPHRCVFSLAGRHGFCQSGPIEERDEQIQITTAK